MTHARGFGTALFAAALILGGSSARGRRRRQRLDPRRRRARVCSDLGDRVRRAAGGPGRRARSRFPREPGKTLRVRLPRNSGAVVRGTPRGAFEVLACKAAPSPDALSRIALSRTGETLTVTGPRRRRLGRLPSHRRPRRRVLELDAVNGPIGLSGLSGRVTARLAERPDLDPGLRRETSKRQRQNGPIDVRGEGGRLRVKTQNGPIGVTLSGGAWKGEGLEASAVNGPVSLAIPAGYRSGAVVESLGRSPFRCRGEACDAARRTFDDDRKRIEFGEGPALVRLSTENGPVSVNAGSDADTEED